MSTDTPLLELHRALGNIEAKLDGLASTLNAQNETTVKRLDNHGTRLGALERWRTGIAGGLAVVTAIGAGVWKTLLAK